ncbi:DUF1203 domain-containing protein [Paracoccaceae bacterium Fryx2]|nr:DUF1203 domain-containing protein [Paracoccaceae bacterium Fryx2]
MTMIFTPLPTATVRALQAGGADANGQTPERVLATGSGNPCRHCLKMIPEGAPMLILAVRPFPVPQPYAEVGPVFLCATPCTAGGGPDLPEILAAPDYIVRGYGADDRIVYGTGAVVPTHDVTARAGVLLDDPGVAYVHVRSARNNCYQLRIDRLPA